MMGLPGQEKSLMILFTYLLTYLLSHLDNVNINVTDRQWLMTSTTHSTAW